MYRNKMEGHKLDSTAQYFKIMYIYPSKYGEDSRD
jgi:hypothetical protein